jgi:hypothetical protein
LLALHTWEAVKEFIERIASFQVIEQVLQRHARSNKNPCSAKDFRVRMDHTFKGFRFHAYTILSARNNSQRLGFFVAIFRRIAFTWGVTPLLRLLLLFLICCGGGKTAAMSYISPAFQRPQLFPDRIVFTEFGHAGEAKRVICVRRDGGGKLCEFKTESFVTTQRVDERLLVAEGGKVFECDLKTGARKFLFETGFYACEIIDRGTEIILALSFSQKHGQPSLIAYGKNDWKKIWETEIAHTITWDGGETIFCGNFYTGVAGVRRDSGELVWEKDIGRTSTPTLVGDYLILHDEGWLDVIRQKDGELVSRRKMKGGLHSVVHVYAQGKNALVCRSDGKRPLDSDRWRLQDFAVPSLRMLRTRDVADRAAVMLLNGDVGLTYKGAINLSTGKAKWRSESQSWDIAIASDVFLSQYCR